MMVPRAEHVWVVDVQVWGDRQAPGLLLAWDRREDGWWAHVIVVQLGNGSQGGGPYVKQLWLQAAAIRPAGGVGHSAPP